MRICSECDHRRWKGRSARLLPQRKAQLRYHRAQSTDTEGRGGIRTKSTRSDISSRNRRGRIPVSCMIIPGSRLNYTEYSSLTENAPNRTLNAIRSVYFILYARFYNAPVIWTDLSFLQFPWAAAHTELKQTAHQCPFAGTSLSGTYQLQLLLYIFRKLIKLRLPTFDFFGMFSHILWLLRFLLVYAVFFWSIRIHTYISVYRNVLVI